MLKEREKEKKMPRSNNVISTMTVTTSRMKLTDRGVVDT